MKHEWRELERLFGACADLDDAARTVYIEQLRVRDAPLADELERLLRADRAPSVISVSEGVDFLAQLRPVFDVTVGSQVGPYQLLKKIGEGGMGVVYLAEQQHPVQRRVAVKLIQGGYAGERRQRRFEFEIQTLAQLNHPHIAAVYLAGVSEQGVPFFSMEFVDGRPLNEYCREKALSVHEILALFATVCRAVNYAHQCGVIHRDLKPENILVTEIDGVPHPKIIDFGIARAVADEPAGFEQKLTLPNAVIGTLAYMSPEQTYGQQSRLDFRSDIYSLGVILYELFVGDLPVRTANDEEVPLDTRFKSVREVLPLKPSRAVLQTKARVSRGRGSTQKQSSRNYRGEVDWICLKALAKEPERRYQSANAFAEDCERVLQKKPVTAGPPSRSYLIKSFVRRHWFFTAGMCLLLMSVTVGVMGLAYGFLEAREAERRLRREVESADAGLRLLEDLLSSVASRHQGNQAQIADGLVEVGSEIDQLELKPETRAQVHHIVGEAYRELGDHVSAVHHLNEAWEWRQAQLGACDPKTIQSFVGLGLSKVEMEDPYSALLFLKMLDPACSENPKNRVVMFSWRMAMARVYIELDDISGVKRQNQASNELVDYGAPGGVSIYQEQALIMGMAALQNNEPGLAVIFFRLLEQDLRPIGLERRLYLENRIFYGVAHGQSGNYDMAQWHLEKALSEARETYRENHEIVIRARLGLCRILLDDDRPEEALTSWSEIAQTAAAFSANKTLLFEMTELGFRAALQAGYPEEGMQIVRQFIAGLPTQKMEPIFSSRCGVMLAQALHRAGEHDAAFARAHHAYAIMEDLNHPAPGVSAQVAGVLVSLYADQGDTDSAERWSCLARSFSENLYGYADEQTLPYVELHLKAMLQARNPRVLEEIEAVQDAIMDERQNLVPFWYRLKALSKQAVGASDP